LIAVYEDAGVSAKTLDRPGLQAALADLRAGRVLLALKMDRLTRSVRDLYGLIESIDNQGAEWACVAEKFDTTTATGRLMLNMIVQLSQWEREVIGERTADALAAKRRRGERLGTTPLGYKTVEEDGVKRVVVDDNETATVHLVRKLRADGMSMNKIATELTARGIRSKRGGTWRSATVANILAERYVETLAV
jgi:DNA invertase Pin-like site-specific DNA recombinase